jgi:hypothetical protein
MAENTKQQNKSQISRIIEYYKILLPQYYVDLKNLKNENGITPLVIDQIIADTEFKYIGLIDVLNHLESIAGNECLTTNNRNLFSNINTNLDTKDLINDHIKQINNMANGADTTFLETRRSNDIKYKNELISIFNTYNHCNNGGKRKSRRNRKSKKGKKSKKARKSRRKSNHRRR